MKAKLLFSLFLMVMYASAFSQGPTLTATNTGPVPGDLLSSYNVDTTGVPDGSTGANQTWNYSTLNIDTTQTVLTYVTPSATPYASSFPAATVAYANNSLYSYIDVNSIDYKILGMSNSYYTMVYSDPEILFTYPFSYGSSITDSLSGSYTFSTVSFYRKGTRTTTADGWGKLILPSGTYTNLLRVKVIQNYKDSSNVGGVTYVYNVAYLWYDGVHKTPSLEIYHTSNTNGTTVTSKYVTVSSAVSGISEQSNLQNTIDIYPNPASNFLFFNFNNSIPATIEIMDVNGQILIRKKSRSDHEKIDLSSFSKGMYFWKALLSDGKMSSGKFIVR